MKFKSSLLAVTAVTTSLAFASVASAQPVTGPYVNWRGGLNIEFPVNLQAPGNITGQGGEGKYLTKLGGGGVGGIGYGFGNGFRIEIGPDFLTNTVKKIDFDNGNQYQINGQGSERKFGPLVTGYYDFDLGLPIYPFVGAGIGYQYAKFSKAIESTNGPAYTRIGGTKGSFAWVAAAGIAYPIDAVPGLSLTAEYRFMQLTGTRKYNYSLTVGGVATSGNQLKAKTDNNNMIMFGLRYQWFTAPAPAPMPAPAPVAAPAPAPAKTYLVFFDWDKYNLTPRATQIIAQAAADSKTQSVTTIDVNGYTDTSGTPAYNQKLSVRRAKAVAAQLVVDGVPASEITAQGFGDTNLLVPTGPGVREPQNRRVEIISH